MDPIDYQQKAMETAAYPDQLNNLLYPALGLAGEAGEVAGKIKKLMRDNPQWGKPEPEDPQPAHGEAERMTCPYTMLLDKDTRNAIRGELGDVMWYVAVLATECGLTLNEIMEANIEKLADRQARGTIQGSGDNR